MERGGETYYYHFDGLGSVTALSDSLGDLTESYSYDIFGRVKSSFSSVGNPYYFTGRRYDPETGLYYYRARVYSPSLGRFLQTDPIGYESGINLYTYVGNNPVNFIDPRGLSKEGNKGIFPGGVYTPDGIDPTGPKVNMCSPMPFSEKTPWWKWTWRHTYVDIGTSFSTVGKLGPGINVGIQIAPSGGYWYYGFGLGVGIGASATVNIGTPPSSGTAIVTTVRGGTGWGGQARGGVTLSGKTVGNIGGGAGILVGGTVTTTRTYRIISW